MMRAGSDESRSKSGILCIPEERVVDPAAITSSRVYRSPGTGNWGVERRVLYSSFISPFNNYYVQLQLHELKQWTEEIITVGREEISALARCIKQFVLTVEKSVRFPSSPPRGDLFTATSAFRNTGSPGTNFKKPTSQLIFYPIYALHGARARSWQDF